MSYNDNLGADQQISMEERIAGELFNGGCSEDRAAELSREILLLVLQEFRPDLIADEDDEEGEGEGEACEKCGKPTFCKATICEDCDEGRTPEEVELHKCAKCGASCEYWAETCEECHDQEQDRGGIC